MASSQEPDVWKCLFQRRAVDARRAGDLKIVNALLGVSGNLVFQQPAEILQILIEDYTQKEIAAALSISPRTVDTHLRNIYAKLQAHSRSEAINRSGQSTSSVKFQWQAWLPEFSRFFQKTSL